MHGPEEDAHAGGDRRQAAAGRGAGSAGQIGGRGGPVRAIGVTGAPFYRWRAEFGGLKLEQVKRLKAREAESARLRKAVADLTLEKVILKGAGHCPAPSGNF
jgi:hypothetical protein